MIPATECASLALIKEARGRSELSEMWVKGQSEGAYFVNSRPSSFTVFCLHFGSNKTNHAKQVELNYRFTNNNHGKSWLTIT